MSPVLSFDDPTHTYTLTRDDGTSQVLPSVTTVLRGVNLIDLGGIPADTLDAARERGRRVHKAAQFLTEGTLDWSTVPRSEVGYVEAYARFLDDARFIVTAQEVRLWHPVHGYAGTTDALGFFDGHPAIGDLKSGDPDLVAARYQLAAYELCIREHPPLEWLDFTPTTPVLRVSIAVRRDGTYKADIYRDPSDKSTWLAALSVYRAIAKKRQARS